MQYVMKTNKSHSGHPVVHERMHGTHTRDVCECYSYVEITWAERQNILLIQAHAFFIL